MQLSLGSDLCGWRIPLLLSKYATICLLPTECHIDRETTAMPLVSSAINAMATPISTLIGVESPGGRRVYGLSVRTGPGRAGAGRTAQGSVLGNERGDDGSVAG